MALKGIDISNHQGDNGLNLDAILKHVDFVICKATESTGYVDPYCDGFMQKAMKGGKKVGFYHFMREVDAADQARFFISNTRGYFGKGIPILDWEVGCTVKQVNRFVRYVHDETGVWPWIYANPWRFNQGGVEANCGRWIASYPNVVSPSISYKLPDAPKTDGLVCCWQYCSDGKLDGYGGNLDFDRFFGSADAWDAYVGEKRDGNSIIVVENDDYRVTIEEK